MDIPSPQHQPTIPLNLNLNLKTLTRTKIKKKEQGKQKQKQNRKTEQALLNPLSCPTLTHPILPTLGSQSIWIDALRYSLSSPLLFSPPVYLTLPTLPTLPNQDAQKKRAKHRTTSQTPQAYLTHRVNLGTLGSSQSR